MIAVVLLGFGYFAPPTSVPPALVLIALVLPLLIPLRGILHGRLYTHAWVSMLALGYFAIAVDIAYNRSGVERWIGLIMVACSVAMFFGDVYWVKLEARRRRHA